MESEYTIKEVIHEAELDDKYELVLKKEKDIEKHLLKIKEHYRRCVFITRVNPQQNNC